MRLFLRVTVVLVLLLQSGPAASQVRAQDPCADLAGQVAAEDKQLDTLKQDAQAQLRAANVSAAAVGGELAAAAVQDSTPLLTPDLAAADGAIAAQVGVEMAQLASDMDAEDSATFASDFSQAVLDWQTRLTSLETVETYSANLHLLLQAVQSLAQISTRAQAALALRDNFNQSLAACQSANPQSPALGCGLTYFGLDRSTPRPALKSAVPGLPSGAMVGDQWDFPSSYTTSEGSMVDVVDTYTCTDDGATKVGRTAVQTFPDGSTEGWGEGNYVGTLWPKTIAPGASWTWQAVQYTGADQETWSVSVQDAAREPLQLPQGKFVAIQLHMEEDILQSDGETLHESWDEWYAQPQP